MAGSFDLSTPRQLLAKLSRELDRLRTAPNDVDHAFNFFVTAEHMLDWLHPGNKGKARREAIRKGEVMLQVVSFKVEDQGQFRTPEYYCDISTISVRYPQICPCCQGPMVLRMKPETR